jgi:hypothetical protein
MVAFAKGTKLAIVFGVIGIVAGIGITLALVNNQTEGMVFQRAVEDDNPWLDPSFLASYNENVRTGAYYKTRLAVGEEGFFISSAKGGKEPYMFEWKFSDGITLSTANTTRSFDSPGRYNFDLIVTDSNGKQGKSTGMYVDAVEQLPEETPIEMNNNS